MYGILIALKRSDLMRIEYQMGITNLRLSKLINGAWGSVVVTELRY